MATSGSPCIVHESCPLPGGDPGISLPGAGGAFRAPESEAAHRTYLELDADPGAVPHARRYARQTLVAWCLGHLADNFEVVVSELVTNAIEATLALRAAAPVTLYLAAADGSLYVLVWDCCQEAPAQRPHAEEEERGRGLEIVAALASQWGAVIPVGAGKVTWARMDLAGQLRDRRPLAGGS
jgi:anti-sigma regulatory factor (Ser/Thr protein kinase)